MSLLAVDEALGLIRGAVTPTELVETVPLVQAAHRTLAEPIRAPRDQPPFAASAMDGYGVRAADLPGSLRLVGESAAGRPFKGRVGPGECCRIFTGAPVPDGVDAVLIQENADVDADVVRSKETIAPGRYVRAAGLDYRSGATLLDAGALIDADKLALIASTGAAQVKVRVRPKVAVIMSGDELRLPGDTLSSGDIYASNGVGVSQLIADAGGEPVDCGIVRDDRARILDLLGTLQTEIVVTLGGASVGDHDLIAPCLREHGVDLRFWKLAMRPGKPILFGTRGKQLFLGLPGNPVSSLVGARILLRPLVHAVLRRSVEDGRQFRPLAVDLPANGDREHYMRARTTTAGIEPLENQDSSLLAALAGADVLLVRERNEGPRKAGELVPIVPLRG